MNKTILAAALSLLLAGMAQATDVDNKDKKAYKLRVQNEGKAYIANYVIRANVIMYGLCSAAFCTFEIPGSKIEAKKDDRIAIRDGKFIRPR